MFSPSHVRDRQNVADDSDSRGMKIERCPVFLRIRHPQVARSERKHLSAIKLTEPGEQVNQQDDQVAHREMLAASPRTTKLDILYGLRDGLVIRHPQV